MKTFLYVLIVIFLGFFSGYFLLSLLISSGTVDVPDLIGKDIVTANQLLREKGLHIRIDGHEHSETPVGTVSKQEPPAGTKIKGGREISVIVSKGLKFSSLPEIRGLPLEEAERILRDRGVPIEKIIYISSEKYPDKTVIAQRPESQEGGKAIKLLVSKGRKED